MKFRFFIFLLFFCSLVPLRSGHAQEGIALRLIETPRSDTPTQQIRLQSLRINTEISGGLAQTTVQMVFFNPNQRLLEGTLHFPLLPEQQITAFALDVNGVLRPAVPVEKAKGRQVFEEIERRQVDPGLLEKTEGNNFRLRIYPIPAQGVRTVQLQYAEPLARQGGNWAYRLPLAYGETMRDFDFALKVAGSDAAPKATGALGKVEFTRADDGYRAHIAKSHFAPSGRLDLLIPAKREAQVYTQARDGDTYFLAEVPVESGRSPRALPKRVGLLWDSSGSGAKRAQDAELAELGLYFKALNNAEVRLIRLRDRPEAGIVFKIVNGDWSALRQALKTTVYDGASALADWQPQADIEEYLLVSDGLLNYGPQQFPVLGAGQRLYALSSALSTDSGRLTALAERSGGRLIQIDAKTPGSAAKALLTEGSHLLDLSGNGVADLQAETPNPEQGMLRVAGRLSAANASLQVNLTHAGKTRTVRIPLTANGPGHPLAAYLWAAYRLHALEADYEMQRAAIRRLGQRFGLPTRETSLIVLDQVEDYARYDIAPPAELQAQFDQIKNRGNSLLRQQREAHLDKVVRQFNEKVTWWEKTYPKTDPARLKIAKDEEAEGRVAARAQRPQPAAAQATAEAPPPPAPMVAPAAKKAKKSAAMREGLAGGVNDGDSISAKESTTASEIGIALKKWSADAAYIQRLKKTAPDKLYAVYLDEKPSYTNSSAFFLDVADVLLEHQQRDLGLRVLSNLAELDLENRQVLRILGYRLLQAGAPRLAIPVFEKVQSLAEEEPQSFRDLGLAYAADRQYQKAVDQLNEVILRPWDNRFAEIELIALAEMNAIIATAPGKLDTRAIDPRLLKNLALDLRVVLTWDADNTDMDLWVTDPNGEKCFYSHRFTYQGGRMSIDFTGGYGPEEFSLRKAKPGKYKIEANFYGSRQQTVAGATTLQVKLSTDFGGKNTKDEMLTLRLKEARETVFVGEFEVK